MIDTQTFSWSKLEHRLLISAISMTSAGESSFFSFSTLTLTLISGVGFRSLCLSKTLGDPRKDCQSHFRRVLHSGRRRKSGESQTDPDDGSRPRRLPSLMPSRLYQRDLHSVLQTPHTPYSRNGTLAGEVSGKSANMGDYNGRQKCCLAVSVLSEKKKCRYLSILF